MKKTFVLLLCAVVFEGIAQRHVDTGVAAATNAAFSQMELNRVPNNLLMDYGYDFVQVTNYDGVLHQ